jgi:KRAB domain-containing zinc finger protein
MLQFVNNVQYYFFTIGYCIFYKIFLVSIFSFSELKPSVELRSIEGSILKSINDPELAKTLGIEVAQNLLKVNVDEINQLLTYHEVFGKLQNDVTIAPSTNSFPASPTSNNSTSANQVAQTAKPVELDPLGNPHSCELCGKMFSYRYQLIVHRRYHTEKKPFTCQV